MTTILCIDTATPQCGIAILHHNEVYVEAKLAPSAHANVVLPMVDRVCQQAGIKASDCNAIGVTVGPGSFIGVRTGVCVAQAMAFAHDIPVVGLSVLAVLAQTAFDHHNSASHVISAWDARMKSLYWGGYILEAGLVKCIIPDQLSRCDQLRHLPWSDALLVGNAWQAYDLGRRFSRTCIDDLYPAPSSMLKLVADKYAQGDSLDPTLLQPLYLRNDVARIKRSK